jgi:hypothetical protein
MTALTWQQAKRVAKCDCKRAASKECATILELPHAHCHCQCHVYKTEDAIQPDTEQEPPTCS